MTQIVTIQRRLNMTKKTEYRDWNLAEYVIGDTIV